MKKNYDHRKTEREMQDFWRENNIYAFDEDSRNEIFSIDTPPPTVSGSLHIGHIFSYTQAEMIARFKRMQGFNVYYPFGFDDNGLPTERLVEREEGITAKQLPRSEFIDRCKTTTEKYEKQFGELWESLGFSVDWSLQYETINPMVQKISQKSFLRLLEDGKAYMKESPVLWCTECGTSIAQAELDTVDRDTDFNYIPFEVEKDKLIVATTRPELLYGCVCLFVNPGDERYKNFVGRTAEVPLYGYSIPVLADEKVSQEKGTGVVMCATFGDSTDAEWFETHRLPYRKVINPDGTINRAVPLIGGLKVTAARKEIIRLLSEKGLLIESQNISHTVAIHERCGKEIEIIPSRQWYIDILSNRELFLKAADKINWYPPQMKTRYTIWVENLKWDWCISRQRYFGIPIPIWYCKDCGKIISAREEQLPVNPLETAPGITCDCGCNEFIAETSIFDTWATSSLTPQINAKWGEEKDISDRLLPMSMRTQAHEIIRTWAFYTIVKSLYHTGEVPWRDIMICGYVLAKKGEKISKSKNNSGLSPSELIEAHSADIIRYWAANSRLGTDTFFAADELGIARRFITKLWNAVKFATFHLEDFEPGAIKIISEAQSFATKVENSTETLPPARREIRLLPVDCWIIERCRETISKTAKLLERYEIGLARHEADDFFWKDLCDYYLEIVKERLYQPEKHGYEERCSAQYALYYCILNVLKLYAVYVPHITEYLYQEFFRGREGTISIHKLIWEKIEFIDENIISFGERLKEIISDTRKYKSENSLSMKTEIDKVFIECAGIHTESFQKTIGDIKACCGAREVEIKLS